MNSPFFALTPPYQVQTKQERTRLTELNHLSRLILLVAFLWLNNGTATASPGQISPNSF